jgi:hypothetical protein
MGLVWTGNANMRVAGAGLLEQKGIHPPATHRGNDIASRSGGGQDTHGSHGSHGAENGDKEKLSLKDKIKAKLHKSSTSS